MHHFKTGFIHLQRDCCLLFIYIYIVSFRAPVFPSQNFYNEDMKNFAGSETARHKEAQPGTLGDTVSRCDDMKNKLSVLKVIASFQFTSGNHVKTTSR